MRPSTSTALTLAALAGLSSGSPLRAQESTTRGFNVGLHVTVASLVVESEDRSNAGGAGLQLGYGVNRLVTILAEADGAEFDRQPAGDLEGTWTMGHFDLGVRFHFANSLRSWVPFLQASIGARAVSVQDPVFESVAVNEVTFSGGTFTLGGGIDLYFTQGFAADVQLLWSGGEFGTITVDNVSRSGFDLDARSSRLNLGVVWWP